MGAVDSIPVVSQTKSAVQAICGDVEGARRTQENFVDTCPVVSQTKSYIQWANDDAEGARQTQLKFAGGLSDLADGIPVVGHAKGAIHYACGDKKGGDKAMKSSSRTVGVMGGGVGGFLVGGPAGAVAGGVAGGLAMDGVTTGVDSAIHDEYRPSGTVAAVTILAKGESESVSGDIFDVAFGTAMDGVAGLATGEQVCKATKVRVKGEGKLQGDVPQAKQAHIDPMMKDMKSLKGKDVMKVHKEARDYPRAHQRPKHTNHNIHGLAGDRQGQIASDLQPARPRGGRGGGRGRRGGGRCPERVIFEDPKRNYTLTYQEYLDGHNYGAPGTGTHPARPQPNIVQKPCNWLADHPKVHVPLATLEPATQPKGVAHFDYLVIGDTPGALASAKEAAKLGKRVAVVIAETESYKHYTVSVLCPCIIYNSQLS